MTVPPRCPSADTLILAQGDPVKLLTYRTVRYYISVVLGQEFMTI